MSTAFEWPDSTNKGTAMLKRLHQRLPNPLFEDEYLRWFVDDSKLAVNLSIASLFTPEVNPEEEFQRVAFWYAGLRERFFDDLIEESMQGGARQLLLLGSGFDTRYLRLNIVANTQMHVFEVDLEPTIEEKADVLRQKLGAIPPNLHLVPFDLNNRDLRCLFDRGLRRQTPTVCIWQGVSYYLPEDAVQSVVEFMSDALPPRSTIGFDCCSPLMIERNDRVPGIRFNIDRLESNGEPYLFGMESSALQDWLRELGLSAIQTYDQSELEARYRPGIDLPNDMWYVVTAQGGGPEERRRR